MLPLPCESAALDCRAEPRKRLPQILIRDFRHVRGNARRRGRIGSDSTLARSTPQRSLPQYNTLHRTPAKESIDAFADHVGKMLDLNGCWPLDAQNKRSGGATEAQSMVTNSTRRQNRPRPLYFDRLAARSDLAADDFNPARHQLGRSKTLSRKSLADDLADQVAQRFGERVGGLVHNGVLCHASNMTLAVRTAVRQRAKRPTALPYPQPTALLAWYDRHRRKLPWRVPPGERADPYRVWLSEIMLQQTTVAAVAPYYAHFLARWGDVRALAAAPLEEVLKAWAGLGYYARARNLHACARAVVDQHDGKFPQDETALRALPGIGVYTAAAIAAIAFDAKASPVDGNIERVIARLFAVTGSPPDAKPELHRLARELTPQRRTGDFAQAMMDLGATICTAKKPACAFCPWNESCAARVRGDAETFPRRMPKREGTLRRGAAFVAHRTDGFLLVRTRPAKGLLGGMTEVPTTDWMANFDEVSAQQRAPRFGSSKRPIIAAWRRRPGLVRHVFTHFPLELSVHVAELPADTPAPAGMRWIAIADIAGEALPSLMRKVIAHAVR